jgi:hypothetical protein
MLIYEIGKNRHTFKDISLDIFEFNIYIQKIGLFSNSNSYIY